MQIGDLVKVRKGFFMGGLMGIVVSERQSAYNQKQFFVRLIGNVPTALKKKLGLVLYRPDRLTLIKSSNDRGQ